MKKQTILSVVLLMFSLTSAAKVIKVLAIGNSFSQDAVVQYLYDLAKAQGDSLVIGNAYIPGCPIDRHLENLRYAKHEYLYQKIVGGIETDEKNADLRRIILDEPWDVITLQQASQFSGLPESYVNLPKLKRAVLLLATNHDVKFMWHMTWAYAKSFKDERFTLYGNDQNRMYKAIVGCVRTEVPNALIKEVIPTGTAIRLARYHFGDVLNRDGMHLSYTLGRYTAACTWCEALTGRNIDGNSYIPANIKKIEAQLCQIAAHEAIFMQKIGQYDLVF